MTVVIKEIDNLLSRHLINKSVKDVKFSRLSPPGENFGSIMYKLDVVTSSNANNDDEEVLHVVAKILPESKLWREIFNVQVTFTNEMAFYEIIVPIFQEFQRQLGIKNVINCFAECLGARKNLLKHSNVIDDDAVLILDNLILKGFVNADRLKGIGLDTAKLVLRDIAQLHAVALALKLKNTEKFEKVKKFCHCYTPNNIEEKNEMMKLLVLEDDECAKHISKIRGWGETSKASAREPFATIVHEDLWINNTMQKYVDGKPVENKLVDFQIFDYGSPANDVFFFLWSSVPREILEESLDYLLEFYHENLIANLEKHKCDVSHFTYEFFLLEMKHVSSYQVGHALLFHLLAVNGKKGGHDESNEKPSSATLLQSVPLKAKEKAWYMIRECHKRGWLD